MPQSHGMKLDAARILLVEPEDATAEAFVAALRAAPGFQLTKWVRALDHGSALVALDRDRFDVVVMGEGIGERGDVESVRTLLARRPEAVIVWLGDAEPDERVLRAGAHDHLVRSALDPEIVGRCLRHAISRRHYEDRLRELSDQLAAAHADLARQIATDSITGLGNRRAFDRALDLEWRRSARRSEPLALLIVDLDGMAAVNDQHGLPTGDDALGRVAAVLRETARRAGEQAFRIGGDEFAVIVPRSDQEAIQRLGGQIVDGVRSLDGVLPIRVSVGGALMTALAGHHAQELVGRADEAAFRAKRQGGDRVIVLSVPAPPREGEDG
ncbi:MAG: diguanylate cyclase [Planctomycetota bacterium]